MTDLHIREARDADREAIRAVTLAAYAEYAPIMPDLWEGYRQNILATLADVAPAEQFVAEVEGVLAGTVLLLPAGVPLAGPDGQPLPWPGPRPSRCTPRT